MDTEINIEKEKASEKRKEMYEIALMVEFPEGSGDMITYDEATKLYNSYSIVDDEDIVKYLKGAIKKAKAYIKEMFPDEN